MKNRKEYALLCQNICYLRKKHGLSRTAMARKLHITTKTLDLLESGIIPEYVYIDFLFHIQKDFGISPTQMLSCSLSDA